MNLTQPQLKPFVHLFEVDEDTYLLYDWGRHLHYRFRASPEVVEMLMLADGKRTLDEIAECAGVTYNAARRAFGTLIELGTVFDGKTRPSAPDSVVSAFLPFVRGWEDAVVMANALRMASVVIVGVGGIGTWVVQALAMQGVRELILIDPDVVTPGNLYRQVLFTPLNVGASKVKAAAEAVARIGDTQVVQHPTRIDTINDLVDLNLGDVDLIISCADEPSATQVARTVSSWALDRAVPHIVGVGYTSAIGALPVTIDPRMLGSVCLDCVRKAEPIGRYICRGEGGMPLTAAAAILGNLVALEAVRVLTGFEHPRYIGRRGFLNAMSLEVQVENRLPDPECGLCRRLFGHV